MVGSGSSFADPSNVKHFDVLLKLNYRIQSSSYRGLISGTLESRHQKDNPNYFEPIAILGFNRDPNYEYTLVEKANGSCLSGNGEADSLSPGTVFPHGACAAFRRPTVGYELEYGSDCGGAKCNPFGGNISYLPNMMYLQGIQCMKSGKVQMLLGFVNSSYSGSEFPFDPNVTLIAEGAWDAKRNRLCSVACRILNVTESWANAFAGDCSIRLSLTFTTVFSLRNRSKVVGEISTSKDVNSSGYFGKIGFRSYWTKSFDIPSLKYEYTELDSVRKSCAKGKTVKGKGKTYSDGSSWDMRFDMLLTDSKGKVATGFSSPLFVGDQRYALGGYGRPPVVVFPTPNPFESQLNNHSSTLKISYDISLNPPPNFVFGGNTSSREVYISAEGMYYRDTGTLCMIGCRHLGSNSHKLISNDSLDCAITINAQFPPLHTSETVKGTIESTRPKSDPLYFERVQFLSNSITNTQAKESIWRMDLEIILVLISNTLACIFVGLQLFYVKRHPRMLPFISIVMLIVLTLGHMIPLLLNFEALFVANRNQSRSFIGGGGWLEVNEVIVRVVTMIAFLLELRLLQLTWSARQDDGSPKDLWVSDRKVLYVTSTMYIAGGLIAWVVYLWKNSYSRPLGPFHRPYNRAFPQHNFLSVYHEQHYFWQDLKSYAGLLLDGFLLPQILFNIFFNSGEKALASSFYVGTTVVRLLPHAYDLYRAQGSTRYPDLSYIYANHRMDFYSTAWDIVITCGGLLLVVLIFCQQRFGGHCILPKRFRGGASYEKVPVISNDEL